MRAVIERFERIENRLHHVLVQHSITVLRIAVGAVFLGFGILKFLPHISPAENLTEKATSLLTLGLVPGSEAIVFVAALECFIGICLLLNRWMRLAVWLLVAEFVGVLSPLVLLPSRLFSGPHHAPTLEGQYVLKDIVLVAAGMVIAAASFRGGRLTREDPPPSVAADSRPLQTVR
ncbi:MAG: DoxX family membrane protein [Solirubrobacteraceae bacterium]